MKRIGLDVTKVFIIFIVCTMLFYLTIRLIYFKYEQYHRYQTPEGPAIKILKTEESLLDRLNLFFQLGE